MIIFSDDFPDIFTVFHSGARYVFLFITGLETHGYRELTDLNRVDCGHVMINLICQFTFPSWFLLLNAAVKIADHVPY